MVPATEEDEHKPKERTRNPAVRSKRYIWNTIGCELVSEEPRVTKPNQAVQGGGGDPVAENRD